MKSKVLVVKKDQRGSCEKVRVSGEEMEEVGNFNYMGMTISTNGGTEEEVAHRVLERKDDAQRSMISGEVKRE